MAWHNARHIDRVAAAGKAVHPLPLFINAALNTAESLPEKSSKATKPVSKWRLFATYFGHIQGGKPAH
jgi:hypothetical protein